MAGLDTLDRSPLGDAVVVTSTAGMDRPEWLDVRRKGIGGSDAAAICGLSQWRTPLAVWLEKVAAPDAPDDEDSEAALWGRLLEPVVADETAARTGVELFPVDAVLAHPLRSWQLASVDRGARRPTGELGVYEGKTAGYWSADDWSADQVPEPYLLQGMHYLAVTGLGWVMFAVLIAGQRLAVRIVQRDEELIDHLVAIEAEFWQMVEDRTPPPVTAADRRLLEHLYDVREGAVLTVGDDDDVVDLVDAYREAHAAVKAAEADKELAGNRLRAAAGEHEVVVTDSGRKLFTWKTTTSRRLDQEALSVAHPDIADAFKTERTERRLYVPTPRKADR